MVADILVVEDTPASLELLADLLAAAGHTVRPAEDGRMALRSATIRPPDLVLLDAWMPGMDGYKVCRRLKANLLTRDIPVIFLSALQDTSDKVLAFELGAVDYIGKPYQPEELLARVHLHLELGRWRARLETELRQRTAQLEEADARLRDAGACLEEAARAVQGGPGQAPVEGAIRALRHVAENLRAGMT